jgi:hypothetical protein
MTAALETDPLPPCQRLEVEERLIDVEEDEWGA